VDVSRPTAFADTDRTSRWPRGLGGRALGLWERGEQRGRADTPRREGDVDGVAEPCSSRPGRRSNRPGAGSNGLANPGRCDVSGDAANEIAMGRVAVQVSAVQ